LASFVLDAPGSPVERGVALDPSFPVVLANFPGILGCICGDDRRTILHFRNLKRFKGWLVKPGIMGIGRGNRAGKRETVSIDQSAQLVPSYLFIAIIADRSPFSPEYPSYPLHSARDRSFGSRPRPEQVEEDRLVHPLSDNSRWYR